MKIPLNQDGVSMQDYSSENLCTWCSGCGDYGIWSAAKQVLVELGIKPWQVLLCYDVGCHGNMSDKINAYTFHGLHGRVIPFAAGAKIANPNVPVIAFGGDGASFSEGVGHLVHAVRSNYPITFVLHNNANYGLTTGQASALTWQEQAMNSSPNGMPERTLPSMDFIFSLQPTFVARGFSGNIPQMKEIFMQAIKHRGFAFVDILQSCPTYNKFASHKYLLDRCYDVKDDNHNVNDFEAARALAVADTSERIATGVLYQNEEVPNLYENLLPRQGRKTTAVEEVEIKKIDELMKEFI
ncbi:2-oxoacid:ferredoxin oxidoreductase subunit beta [Candidatus Peregrinibacteria bacterium]|mgnify:CR=1 FL=1|jgi:2-oxoglutarate ferredoxin oxidoreductase subunit beta|nr:2-oxoacid:ferredoxin oxidoreductase subunit beta [Candidatus Peregrinibacteria bacterium]MBT3598788.1 2-oxoacid:ferredoxin oxidoreductase subunit beta [Candidatus Peregrinibacteria bacterium]MBT4367370.1 2-oxoacid:ferredoxin oxidoreductase subunit beta [Candidatus Peregrinibacteria bacterium]MBT4585856.1 2-oxoacid:ferredoxin oxidoreductase subunit beta [Candidatus Peregrinibacteria bacterium]MBT6731202.1 2-oxoacid:ferredoxin oxidoreductase subunit beta [Candidatus Peregrinibacteria bacterium